MYVTFTIPPNWSNDTDFNNDTDYDYDGDTESPVYDKLLLSYDFIMPYMIALSITCSIIHIFKFFRSRSPQSLANKNLTLYCSFLMANNIYIALVLLSIIDEDDEPLLGDKISSYIGAYVQSATMVFKFIIALDICLCFRKIALYLQRPSGPQTKKFRNYCILGLSIPILQTFLQSSGVNDVRRLRTFAIVRIARLIPIVGAFWYIRSASIDKEELWSKFSLHMRLLIMIGGVSSVVSVAEIIIMEFFVTKGELDFNKLLMMGSSSSMINNFGASLEAISIGIFFTFKKDTFNPIVG